MKAKITEKQSIITKVCLANRHGRLYILANKDNDVLITELYKEGKILFVQSFKYGTGWIVPRYARLLEW